MPRGGRRTPGPDKKIGRPKVDRRPVNQEVAQRIKAKVNAEKLMVFSIMTAAKKAKETGNTSDLLKHLSYLDDRDFGRTVATLITADTRETAPELDFGNLLMPAAPTPRSKPN